VRAELLADVQQDGARLARALRRLGEEARLRLEALSRGLPRPGQIIAEKAQTLDGWIDRLLNARSGYFERRREALMNAFVALRTPRQQIEAQRLTLLHAGERIVSALRAIVKDRRQRVDLARLDPERLGQMMARLAERLAGFGQLLDSLSYERVLGRGFALVRDAAGSPVLAAASVRPGSSLEIQFADGTVPVTADGGSSTAARKSAGRHEAAKTKNGKKQGSLF
jgi:exodeoxyribonuclease VII large subunit